MLAIKKEAITHQLAIITKIIVDIAIKLMNKNSLFRTAFFLLMGLSGQLQSDTNQSRLEFDQSTDTAPIQDLKGSGTVYFSPPPGWHHAQTELMKLPVQMMVVGKGNAAIPPSMNLTVEPYKGTLKQYLKLIKDINASKGNVWTDLGKIKTAAGEGSLSQLDKKMSGEDMRMLHTVILKNEKIYILTAAAAKSEFSSFYKQFFAAMTSLHINDEQ